MDWAIAVVWRMISAERMSTSTQSVTKGSFISLVVGRPG